MQSLPLNGAEPNDLLQMSRVRQSQGNHTQDLVMKRRWLCGAHTTERSMQQRIEGGLEPTVCKMLRPAAQQLMRIESCQVSCERGSSSSPLKLWLSLQTASHFDCSLINNPEAKASGITTFRFLIIRNWQTNVCNLKLLRSGGIRYTSKDNTDQLLNIPTNKKHIIAKTIILTFITFYFTTYDDCMCFGVFIVAA